MFQKGLIKFLIVAFLFLPGCSSDDNPGDRIFKLPNSDLSLSIPGSLGVADDAISEIYYFADQVPHCFRTDGLPIDIVLAEATVLYFQDYLFPEYFPVSLDTIPTVEAYVDYLGQNDQFTFWLSPQEYAFHSSVRSGDRALIGIQLNFSGPTVTAETPLTIAAVTYLYSAWVDGLKIGDKLVEIDGMPIRDMDEAEVLALLPNSEGETATFTVVRNDSTIDIPTAAEEHIGRLLRPDLAYLNARSFTQDTGKEVRGDFNALVDASSGTIDKLILDLRDNTGGSVFGAWALVDYLIDMDDGSNLISTYSYREGAELAAYLGDYSEYDIGNFNHTNFVLLIDDYSASSSEITTAALMHYDTVTSMGGKSYGKGVGQLVYQLLDGSAIWVTALEIQGPSGESWHLTGISPDSTLVNEPESFDSDPLIAAAIEFLDNGTLPAGSLPEVMKERARQLGDSGHDTLVEKMREKSRGWF